MRLCATCAGQGKSCCICRDILVSDGDLARISAFTGTTDFFEMRRPQTAAYLDQEDDPNWNLYTVQSDGSRRVVRHASPGLCWFLGEAGCRLPEQTRPLVCRLHPVEFTEERITGLSPECPAEHLPPGETVLVNLAMNLDLAENWRQQLYAELRAAQPRRLDAR
jgi:Fe-S-cluster containining protein